MSPLPVLSPRPISREIAADNNPATTADNNVGLIQGVPIIAKLNNGVTALVVSNGLNSTNDRAVLLVYNLETGALIGRLTRPLARH